MQVLREAGPDRYATAVDISRHVTPGNVIITTGENYADALSAGPFATHSSPDTVILLVQRDSIPDVTRQRLAEYKAMDDRNRAPDGSGGGFTITVVGGTSAISDAVLGDLRQYNGTGDVQRIAGSDRYRTSMEASRWIYSGGLWVASGTDWQNAMLAATAAAIRHDSFLLVPPGDSMPNDVAQFAQDHGSRREVNIVGDINSVSAGIESQLRQYAGTLIRHAGKDQYETAASLGWPDSNIVYFASGEDWPDALTIAPVVAGSSAGAYWPLFLVRPDCIPQAVQPDLNDLEQMRIIGGTGAIGQPVEEQAMCAN